MQINLVMVCVSSFIGVFFVLTFLAVIMRLIMVMFPVKKKAPGTDDAVLYAAITSTYARLYPGTQTSKIEEIKNRKP